MTQPKKVHLTSRFRKALRCGFQYLLTRYFYNVADMKMQVDLDGKHKVPKNVKFLGLSEDTMVNLYHIEQFVAKNLLIKDNPRRRLDQNDIRMQLFAVLCYQEPFQILDNYKDGVNKLKLNSIFDFITTYIDQIDKGELRAFLEDQVIIPCFIILFGNSHPHCHKKNYAVAEIMIRRELGLKYDLVPDKLYLPSFDDITQLKSSTAFRDLCRDIQNFVTYETDEDERNKAKEQVENYLTMVHAEISSASASASASLSPRPIPKLPYSELKLQPPEVEEEIRKEVEIRKNSIAAQNEALKPLISPKDLALLKIINRRSIRALEELDEFKVSLIQGETSLLEQMLIDSRFLVDRHNVAKFLTASELTVQFLTNLSNNLKLPTSDSDLENNLHSYIDRVKESYKNTMSIYSKNKNAYSIKKPVPNLMTPALASFIKTRRGLDAKFDLVSCKSLNVSVQKFYKQVDKKVRKMIKKVCGDEIFELFAAVVRDFLSTKDLDKLRNKMAGDSSVGGYGDAYDMQLGELKAMNECTLCGVCAAFPAELLVSMFNYYGTKASFNHVPRDLLFDGAKPTEKESSSSSSTSMSSSEEEDAVKKDVADKQASDTNNQLESSVPIEAMS